MTKAKGRGAGFEARSVSRIATVALIFLLMCHATLGSDSVLRLVQLVYRHGDRTPSHTFPTDPYRHLWTEGKEMLTRVGMEQQFRLGQYLRQRYRDFLPEYYHYNNTVVRSTDNDRAIQSAEAQRLGLFGSPVKVNSSTMSISLPQFVPIHTVPKPHDQLLKMTSPCPAYKRLWREIKQSDVWKKTEKKYQSLFEYLARSTGLQKVGLLEALHVADPIRVWTSHNLTLPAWATPDVVRQLFAIQDLKQGLRYHTKPMQRLRGGPMVAEMTNNILNKLVGSAVTKQRNLYAYSAHDSTVASIMSYMGIFNHIHPPYASCLILELHQVAGNAENVSDHMVRLYYRNESDKEPWRLKIPNCEFDCSLSEFIRLTQGNLPGDIRKECFGGESQLIAMPMSIHTHAWSLLVSTAMAVAILIFLCTMYKRYL